MKVAILIVKVATTDANERQFSVVSEQITRKVMDEIDLDYANASVMATAEVTIPDEAFDWQEAAVDACDKLSHAVGIRMIGRVQ